MKYLYKPSIYIFVDVLLLWLSIFIVLRWFPLTTQTPFDKYFLPFAFFSCFWLISSYLFGRYKPLKKQQYFKSTFRLFYMALLVLICCWIVFIFLSEDDLQLSQYVLLSVTVIAFSLNYFLSFFYFAFRYATEYEVPNIPVVKRENAQVKNLPEIDSEAYLRRCQLIESQLGRKALNFLKTKIDLKSGNTFIFVYRSIEELIALPEYEYNVIVKLERLNCSRGINKTMNVLNEKLSDDGIFICCFESLSTRKKNILNHYPKLINRFVYAWDFMIHRFIPKFFITRRLYYDITGGKNRILSKTEVIGRLYCNGYEVFADNKIDGLTYVMAKRIKQAEALRSHRYGPLIRLKRYGKNKKTFTVYKFRTMYSYSEYMQSYIYKHNDLQEGGKFKNDIRITSLGHFMRKYWIDEFPMIINLIKGDMKIIGVRPLSAQYFGLYSKELQEKRVKFKPGLLPPFYADMPKDLDEIQASEMKYLEACEEKGVFVTDIRYFFKIINNILFKKARSA